MAKFYQKKTKEPYLTQADIARIKAMDQNPAEENRKCKAVMTLKHPDINAEICIICYGKDKKMLKENIEYNVKFFQDRDKKWTLKDVQVIKQTEEIQDY